MPRQGRFFGIVVLLAAAAVLMLLASRAMEALFSRVPVKAVAGVTSTDAPEKRDAESPPRDLPNLDDMKQRTDAHTRRLEQNLEGAE